MNQADINRADRNMQDLLSQENLVSPNKAGDKVGASAAGPVNQTRIANETLLLNPNRVAQPVPMYQLPAYQQASTTSIQPSPFYPAQHSVVNPGMGQNVTKIAQSRLLDVPLARPVIGGTIPVQSTTVIPQKMQSTSRIEYIPYNKKIVQYHDQQKVTVVPHRRKVVDYKQQKIIDIIPKEAVKQDYYAVQKIRQYVPQYVPETMTVMVQRAVPFKRIQYVPVTRQVYHGAPLGNQGAQSIPFCSGIQGVMNQVSTGYVPWQNNPKTSLTSMGNMGNVGNMGYMGNMSHIYGTTGYQSGYGLTSQCDRFRRNLSSIYDSYDTYIPSFKY